MPADRTLTWAGAIGVALLAGIPRLFRAWESVPDLLARSTWDDTFYYFGIARNIMDGNGASFDGEHVTNGFHPLWLALITPFWAFDGDTPIHLALTLGALFGAGTAATIFLWLMRATDSLAASLIGGAFYALHPAAVTDSVNGMESSVTVFMFTATAYALLALRFEPASTLPGRRDIVLGICCGGLMLARTDIVIVVGVLLGYVALRSGAVGFTRPLAIGAVAFVCVVPWLTWSYVATGSIVQVSGRAGGVQVRQAFEQQHDGVWPTIEHGIDLTWTMLSDDLPHAYVVPGDVPGWAGLVLMAVTAIVIGWTAFRTPNGYRQSAYAVAVLAVGLLAMLAYHSGIRFFTRTWYFAPTAMLVAVTIGLALSAMERLAADYTHRIPTAGARYATAAITTVVAAAMIAVYQPYDAMGWSGVHPHELNAYEGAQWLREETPPGTRAGSFNGGIIGYFSDRTVVNLDGVVNEGAYEALRDREVTTYVREERLEYIVDFEAALIIAAAGPPVVTYEEVARVGAPGGVFGQVGILRVQPSE